MVRELDRGDASGISAAGDERHGPEPANDAVWLPVKHARLQVGPAPYTSAKAGEIVVRNRALAINPIDGLLQSVGDIIFPWIRYPFILGSDVAGEVAEVGKDVTRFNVGDRVVGHAVGSDKERNSSAEGAFQRYTVLLEHMAAPIPASMSYEAAVVLPLGLSTAACGLFQKDHLALPLPSASPVPTGETILVWGGSTSVGSNAIQLAIASGYDVVTTASPTNFGYVKGLGAKLAFDYRSRTVVADIVAALAGHTLAGALAIGLGSAEACVAVLHGCKGKKFVSMASPSVSFDNAPSGYRRTFWLVSTIARLLASNALLQARSRLGGIRTKFIFGSSLLGNEVGPAIYVDFLPLALAEGRYLATPSATVVGRGLDQVQAGLEVHKRGVSARKVVVSL